MKIPELYRFVQEETVWTYTSADRAITYNSEVYEPVPIGRTGIELKNELAKANIDVKLPTSHETAREWAKGNLEATTYLTLFQQSTVFGTNVVWKGRMGSVKPGPGTTAFTFESIFTSLRRPGLRARYLRQCRHALYGRGCGLDKEDFAVVFEASEGSADGTVITIPDLASADLGDYFTGILKSPNGTLRFITAQSATTVTLSRPIASLSEALSSDLVNVTLYPGCDRTRLRCKTRFNNLPRNGSFPFIPIRNPFDGNSIA